MTPEALVREEPLVLDRASAWRPAWPRSAVMIREFSTADTVASMERLAKADQWKPKVRELAIRAWRSVGGRDARPLDVVLALEREVQRVVLYTPDPGNVELVVGPEALLSMPIPAEDCDSMQALLASAMLALALSPRFDRLDFVGDGAPDPYEHVVTQVPIEHEGHTVEVVADPTYPGSVSGMLARVRSAYVHAPIGRPGVRPRGW